MSVTPLHSVEPNSDEKRAELAGAFQDIAPFRGLPAAVHQALEEIASERRYAAGQTVIAAGQFDGDEFYAIVSGQLKVATMEDSSGAVVVEQFNPNQVFGLELAMNEQAGDGLERMALTAGSDLELVVFDAEAFRLLAAQRPSIMRNLAHYFASELASVRFQTVSAQASPERLVYEALIDYVERDAISGEWRIEVMPKHRELADKAGVEEANAANAVAALIQDEVAYRQYPGLIIRNMAKLNALAK